MTVPPLFDHLDTEDEDQLRRDAAPRETDLSASGGPGVDDDVRPAGAHPRLWAWLHVGPFYWVMRVVYVCLAAGAIFAVYINGVSEGWWRAWGEKPSVAATAPVVNPTPAPSLSGEAAMSGGYQIGPDGVLVRPAQYAADTYTKPELPEEAKENTERGAEAAAEHYLALLVYAWNTGDTQPLADMSDPNSAFANTYVTNISDLYKGGWSYGTSSKITDVLRVEPVPPNGADIPDNSVLAKFHIVSIDGIKCHGVRTKEQTPEYGSTLSLILTWNEGKWVEVQGRVFRDE